jgi:hypothetical protein
MQEKKKIKKKRFDKNLAIWCAFAVHRIRIYALKNTNYGKYLKAIII